MSDNDEHDTEQAPTAAAEQAEPTTELPPASHAAPELAWSVDDAAEVDSAPPRSRFVWAGLVTLVVMIAGALIFFAATLFGYGHSKHVEPAAQPTTTVPVAAPPLPPVTATATPPPPPVTVTAAAPPATIRPDRTAQLRGTICHTTRNRPASTESLADGPAASTGPRTRHTRRSCLQPRSHSAAPNPLGRAGTRVASPRLVARMTDDKAEEVRVRQCLDIGLPANKSCRESNQAHKSR
jgi:hypothetical protein